jgi:Amt family ammonium transporter
MTPEEMASATGDSAWMLMSAALVLLMTPALALFYGGMSRQKSAINMMMMSFGTLGLVGVIYVLWGWSMSYGTESVAGWFANPFEFFGLRNSVTDAAGNYLAGANGYANVIDIGFQLTFAVITVAIISGSLANRVKFSTWMIFAGLWVTLAYFPLAHMVWGGGFLSDSADGIAAKLFGTVTEDGEKVAAIAPIDFAGGTVVHINAGMAALILALIIGRSRSFMKTEIPAPQPAAGHARRRAAVVRLVRVQRRLRLRRQRGRRPGVAEHDRRHLCRHARLAARRAAA